MRTGIFEGHHSWDKVVVSIFLINMMVSLLTFWGKAQTLVDSKTSLIYLICFFKKRPSTVAEKHNIHSKLYLQGTNIPSQSPFEDDVPFPQEGYVSSLGYPMTYSRVTNGIFTFTNLPKNQLRIYWSVDIRKRPIGIRVIDDSWCPYKWPYKIYK